MSIRDAIVDCQNDALAGKEINFAEIAEDYGLNAALLERKWNESFPNGYKAIESVKAGPVVVKPTAVRAEKSKIDAAVEKWCAKYNVSVERCTYEVIRGVPYTIIGRFRTRLLGVSHVDARAYKISGAR